MSEMVERLARAMWEAEPDAWGWTPAKRGMSWEKAVEINAIGVTVFRTLSRAAIEAMREPTEAMCEATDHICERTGDEVEIYHAFIDAALS